MAGFFSCGGQVVLSECSQCSGVCGGSGEKETGSGMNAKVSCHTVNVTCPYVSSRSNVVWNDGHIRDTKYVGGQFMGARWGNRTFAMRLH